MTDTQRPNNPISKMNELLLRPAQSLQDLPLDLRWEVVRRHPFYQQFWKAARHHHAGTDANPMVQVYNKLASMVMQNLGVSGEPPDPSSSGADLGVTDLAKQWRNGAIAPMSFAALAGTLIKDLPVEARRMVGELLIESAVPDADMSAKQFGIISRLMRSEEPSLYRYPKRPIIGINMNASQRAIVEAIESFVNEKKEQLEIPEQRRRFDKIADYLAVWDLREGWINDHYEIDSERSFGAMSQQLSEPERTIANNYYAAFEIVSGHSYSFKNWVQLFFFCKLTDQKSLKSLRRHVMRDVRGRREGHLSTIPSSLVSPNFEELVSDANDTEDQFIAVDTIMDIESLIAEKFTNEQIVQKLGMVDGAAAIELITMFRSRLGQIGRFR